MNIVVNPSLVRLQQKTDIFNQTYLIAILPNGTIPVATFMLHHPNLILMRDEDTKIIYEVSVDIDDLPDINYLLESLLNKINLTHVEKNGH